ncbi:nicotinate-nucleotide adenylyltransferase [Calothrix sp. UHCC 0171]|uniref:nicotinate-nucleotide adenylyltransferase n=1 Tax=Calothrix sp. UHCC 0171 TaxID=3110245 RepID=UPI002B1F3267|nr:nicotinate-nucleotide adenylyltransferase [Calothrix sp. UHCC 0171]MEA5574557.1 nicotinate-nucleotide adenylyltransferase [Calothrix sp. UHCC 0171]
MRIALFGTSADPPTAGHEKILRWLSYRFDLVAVWAAENPFKSHKASLEHRVRMLRLLIDGMESSRRNVFLEQDLSSLRTLETLEKGKQRWGNAEYTVVVGSDLLMQLPRWYRIEDLLRQVQLLVIPRPGYAIDETSLRGVQQLGAKIAIASLTGLDVSSTSYREQGDSNALTPLVIDYINQQHLYKCQDAIQTSLHVH